MLLDVGGADSCTGVEWGNVGALWTGAFVEDDTLGVKVCEGALGMLGAEGGDDECMAGAGLGAGAGAGGLELPAEF